MAERASTGDRTQLCADVQHRRRVRELKLPRVRLSSWLRTGDGVTAAARRYRFIYRSHVVLLPPSAAFLSLNSDGWQLSGRHMMLEEQAAARKGAMTAHHSVATPKGFFSE